MLKLKEIQTKPVIYQGLEVEVPVDTNYMWLRHTDKKTVLWASSTKPVWQYAHNLYIPPADATPVAELEHVDLTPEQVKDSLEADEDKPTEQDLEQLGVIENLVKNLRGFADSLESCVDTAKQNPTTESIQALLQHVYAEDGELDTFIINVIEEAEQYSITTDAEREEEEEGDYAQAIKLIARFLK